MRKWFLIILFSFFINKAVRLNFCLVRSINRDRNHFKYTIGSALRAIPMEKTDTISIS
jgi:hypothetical protein